MDNNRTTRAFVPDDASIIEDDYPYRMRSSALRVRTGCYQIDDRTQVQPIAQRRSAYGPIDTRQTEDHLLVRRTRPHPRQPQSQSHRTIWYWLFSGVIGAIIVFMFLIPWGVSIELWARNTLLPLQEQDYRSAVDVQTKGHSERIQVFIDSNDHLDSIVIRDGDIAHAQIIAGSQILNVRDLQQAHLDVHVDPQHSTSTTIAVLVTIVGPFYLNGWTVVPNTSGQVLNVKREGA